MRSTPTTGGRPANSSPASNQHADVISPSSSLVLIYDLVAKAELNNCAGTAIGYEPYTKRYLVDIAELAHPVLTLLKNLLLVDDADQELRARRFVLRPFSIFEIVAMYEPLFGSTDNAQVISMAHSPRPVQGYRASDLIVIHEFVLYFGPPGFQ